MESSQPLTAEEFAARRHEFADGGRWTELVAGRPVALDPPDVEHGTAVFNLTKALGGHLHETSAGPAGYPCFEMGLLLARRPDTVRFPALSFFSGGAAFAEMDKVFTAVPPPRQVVEVVSTQRCRSGIAERVPAYFELGAVDLDSRSGGENGARSRRRAGGGTRRLDEYETLTGEPVLPGFRIAVRELFASPER